jgi:hypothetical protein
MPDAHWMRERSKRRLAQSHIVFVTAGASLTPTPTVVCPPRF